MRGVLLTVMGAPAAATSVAERWVLSQFCLRQLPASIRLSGQIEGGANVPCALKPRACVSSGMLCFYVLTGAHLLSNLGGQNATDRKGERLLCSALAVQPRSNELPTC